MSRYILITKNKRSPLLSPSLIFLLIWLVLSFAYTSIFFWFSSFAQVIPFD